MRDLNAEIIEKLKADPDSDFANYIRQIHMDWAICLNEICERLHTHGQEQHINMTAECALIRVIALEYGFELHKTAGIVVNAAQVTE